jgi:hypothetical protein
VRDARGFFINGHWSGKHAALPSTIGFVERASRLIDHPFDVKRSKVCPARK